MAQNGGFWRRFVAYFIDSIIVNMASFVIGLLLGGGIGLGMGSAGSTEQQIVQAANVGGGILGLLTGWLYYAVLESSAMQGTPGKRALGMIVTDEQGDRIGFGRATGRYFAKILSVLILLFGFFMIGWTQRKQGLHDMLAGTLVFKASPGTLHQASVFE